MSTISGARRLAAALAVPMLLLPAQALADDHRTAAPEGAEVYFITPQDGETVSSPVTVRFGLKGMGVAPRVWKRKTPVITTCSSTRSSRTMTTRFPPTRRTGISAAGRPRPRLNSRLANTRCNSFWVTRTTFRMPHRSNRR